LQNVQGKHLTSKQNVWIDSNDVDFKLLNTCSNLTDKSKSNISEVLHAFLKKKEFVYNVHTNNQI